MVTVKILLSERQNQPGKLAEAELHFTRRTHGQCCACGHYGGDCTCPEPLDGCKLIGFVVWARRAGVGHNVTMPARQYSVNGERRSFALLRPLTDTGAVDSVRTLILDAYTAHVAAVEAAAV